jgi:hypothetical protein
MGLIKDQCTASSYCSLYIGIDLTTNDYFSDDSNRSENSHSESHHIPSTRQIGMHVKPLLSLSKGEKEKRRKKLRNIPQTSPKSHRTQGTRERPSIHSFHPRPEWKETQAISSIHEPLNCPISLICALQEQKCVIQKRNVIEM